MEKIIIVHDDEIFPLLRKVWLDERGCEGEKPTLSNLQRWNVLCIHVMTYIVGLRRAGFSYCKKDPRFLIIVFTAVLLYSLNIYLKKKISSTIRKEGSSCLTTYTGVIVYKEEGDLPVLL